VETLQEELQSRSSLNYIFDGEIHKMEHATDFAYAIEFVDDDKTPEEYLSKENTKRFLYKFVDYLIKYDIEKLKEIVSEKIFFNNDSYDLNIIYRPSSNFEGCGDKGTLGIKFKRSSNDGLD
jgi:hypothetical protein